MGALARLIRFFTGEEDDERKDPDKDKKSDVVGKGQVDHMILKS